VPHRFSIVWAVETGPFCIAMIRYPDATTYGGKKLLVYQASENALRQAESLDPHFTETGLSPIARFIPTERGARMARAFVDAWISSKAGTQ
jgi:hypothetical protein